MVEPVASGLAALTVCVSGLHALIPLPLPIFLFSKWPKSVQKSRLSLFTIESAMNLNPRAGHRRLLEALFLSVTSLSRHLLLENLLESALSF
ncbi:hypothetical protein EDD16DRAFT_1677700 [Pisolithus croceorrhizus]|nr:hypothetical protein EDD16DRAFT_1677700 [Pisolithus croceorrhizus]